MQYENLWDLYVAYVHVFGVPEDIFWNEEWSSVKYIADDIAAYKAYANNPKKRGRSK